MTVSLCGQIDDLVAACADYARALEHWQGRAAVVEAERDELDRQVRELRELLEDRNDQLRKACVRADAAERAARREAGR